MMTLPLSKTLDPCDYVQLADELKIVDKHFASAREQHSARRWEYAMALRALRTWHQGDRNRCISLYDIGGAGSPFEVMLHDSDGAGIWPTVVDPHYNQWGKSLAEYVAQPVSLGRAVFCLSVLEHVNDLDQFLFHLSCLVAPGGLLFLTADYCDGYYKSPNGVLDIYHFSWMRKRIFNVFSWGMLTAAFLKRDFEVLGPADFAWNGAHVYDYDFVSLALVKKP